MDAKCIVCSRDKPPYKCPRCYVGYCSMGCCKEHRQACGQSVKGDIGEASEVYVTSETNADTTCAEDVVIVETDTVNTSIPANAKITLSERIRQNERLQRLLQTDNYLQTQLPVLLSRIDRATDSLTNASSALRREQDRKARIGEVLSEAVAVDPRIKELFELLQQEDFI